MLFGFHCVDSDESEEKETVVGIVTDIDLLHFISSRWDQGDVQEEQGGK